jgi:hypothetical protein
VRHGGWSTTWSRCATRCSCHRGRCRSRTSCPTHTTWAVTEKMFHRLHADFHVSSARTAVREFIRACLVCQRNKIEQLHPAGLLQPLEIPLTLWADIAVDFIEGLPKVNGKSVILTVVDRFSKYVHFLPPGHPYTATTVARVFFDIVATFNR